MKIPKNNNLYTYIQSHKNDFDFPCNGKHICGKCKVTIKEETTPNKTELNLLSNNEINSGVRLACTRTFSRDVEVDYHVNTYNPKENIINKRYKSNFFISDSTLFYADDIIRNNITNPQFNIIIDIGTTTIAIGLVNLLEGKIKSVNSIINPQRKYGHDVISRIQYSSTKNGLEEISSVLKETLNNEIELMLNKNNLSFSSVYQVLVSANTTLNHLLLAIDPSSIAQAPYEPAFKDLKRLRYSDLFNAPYNNEVIILNSLSGYVGGDIVSGIYFLDLINSSQVDLFIDLGTNGEMILNNKGSLLGTSTAAGPAFEGVNIKCGTGAIDGAVSTFKDPNSYSTINNKDVSGICGSGLIDIISYLKETNQIDKSGYMMKQYNIVNDTFLDPLDIREFQLAKSSVYTGIELLLKQENLKPSDIDNLYIAGGFGSNLNVQNLIKLGVIPNIDITKIKIVGNSSLYGLHKLSLTQEFEVASDLTKEVTIINLSEELEFQMKFIENLNFKDIIIK